MNFDWIGNPLAIYAALATGGAAALHLVVSTRIELRTQQQRQLAESQTLRDAIAVLEDKVRELGLQAKPQLSRPAAHTPSTGLNVYKRAEALRMYQQGEDRQSVSSALGLKHAEVALLETVHHLLSSGAA